MVNFPGVSFAAATDKQIEEAKTALKFGTAQTNTSSSIGHEVEYSKSVDNDAGVQELLNKYKQKCRALPTSSTTDIRLNAISTTDVITQTKGTKIVHKCVITECKQGYELDTSEKSCQKKQPAQNPSAGNSSSGQSAGGSQQSDASATSEQTSGDTPTNNNRQQRTATTASRGASTTKKGMVCTAQIKNSTLATYDDSGTCIVKTCLAGYDLTDNQCVKNTQKKEEKQAAKAKKKTESQVEKIKKATQNLKLGDKLTWDTDLTGKDIDDAFSAWEDKCKSLVTDSIKETRVLGKDGSYICVITECAAGYNRNKSSTACVDDPAVAEFLDQMHELTQKFQEEIAAAWREYQAEQAAESETQNNENQNESTE